MAPLKIENKQYVRGSPLSSQIKFYILTKSLIQLIQPHFKNAAISLRSRFVKILSHSAKCFQRHFEGEYLLCSFFLEFDTEFIYQQGYNVKGRILELHLSSHSKSSQND